MGFCDYWRRREPQTPKPSIPRQLPATEIPIPAANRVLHIYVLHEARTTALLGWGSGTAAVRYGGESALKDEYNCVVIKTDTFPLAAITTSGYYRPQQVLDAYTRVVARDIFLHEAGGHDALGWLHYTGPGAHNTVMNDELRRGLGGTTDADRRSLEQAILSTYDWVSVKLMLGSEPPDARLRKWIKSE